MESPSIGILLHLWLTRLWFNQLPTLLDWSFACILLVLVAIALVLVSFQLGTVSFPMPSFSTLKTRFVLLLWVSRLLHKPHDLSLGHCLGRGFVSSILGQHGTALVIISVVALLAPNLDSTAFFDGMIHSLLFNRLR